MNIPGQPSLRSGLFPALRAIALTCVAATCLGAPASRSDAQPDKADAARVLDQFRRSLWADPVYAEFDLRQMPRRGDERLFHGRLWGAQNERGPITRFELDVGKGGFTHRLLVQSGPEPALWVSDGGTSGASNDHALVMPLISGLEMTPFDLTMPYLYWLDFGVSGLQRIRGRPAFIYLFTPPADFSLAYPGIKSMAAYLDTQYDALVQSELVGNDGHLAKTLSLLELRKVGNRWILKDVDVRNEVTRDKTRLAVSAIAVGISVDPSTFDPALLGVPVTPPAEDQISRIAE